MITNIPERKVDGIKSTSDRLLINVSCNAKQIGTPSMIKLPRLFAVSNPWENIIAIPIIDPAIATIVLVPTIFFRKK